MVFGNYKYLCATADVVFYGFGLSPVQSFFYKNLSSVRKMAFLRLSGKKSITSVTSPRAFQNDSDMAGVWLVGHEQVEFECMDGGGGGGCLVVMETFSKTDPERVRASTSSPRTVVKDGHEIIGLYNVKSILTDNSI